MPDLPRITTYTPGDIPGAAEALHATNLLGRRPENADRFHQTADRLARLASDPEVVDKLDSAQRAQLHSVLLALAQRDIHPRFESLYPDHGPFRRALYAKHLEHYRAGARYRERCLMGANRSGKTVCGSFELNAHLTGYYPEWWPGHRFNEPISAWAAGKKNVTLRNILQDELFGGSKRAGKGRFQLCGTGMIPAHAILHSSAIFKSGFAGVVDEVDIRYRDSQTEFSHLGLRAYEQGTGVFEGTFRHFIWLDEEPASDIYGECLMRTTPTRGNIGAAAGSAIDGGLIVITFTPLEGLTNVVLSFLPAELRPVEYDDADEFIDIL